MATLDALRPAALDAAVWSYNLDALRETQLAVAERLALISVPQRWHAVGSLDGVLTWRIEERAGPAAWLDGTALPGTRAEAMDLRAAADRNIALATIGTGHEPASLLARAPATQAIFVFEDIDVQLAAVLRTVPFDQAIRQRRLWFLPGLDDATPLLRLLDGQRGLLPPGIILHLPNVAPERISILQETLRRATEAVTASRSAQLAEARARLSDRTKKPQFGSAQRFAVVSATGEPQAHAAARALAAAMREESLEADALVLDRPDRVHALWSAERLAELAPTDVIFTDAAPQTIELPDSVRAAVWHACSAEGVRRDEGRIACRYAATPRLLERLRAASGDAGSVRPLLWAATDEQECPPAAEGELPHGAIVVLGDLPDDTAEACGIDQPAHKLLWQALQGAVTARWETRDILFPEALLSAVEREAGVSLRDALTRCRMLHQIERRLAPARAARRLLQAAGECGRPVVVFGDGWHLWTDSPITISPRSTPGLLPRGWRPLAAVLPVCADPFMLAMQAAGRGWPLLVHAPGGDAPDGSFGGVLCLNRDFGTFRTARDLLRQFSEIARDARAVETRATRTAARISREHSWAARARELSRGTPS